MDYLHLGEEIDRDNFIITTFYVESDLSLVDVAEAIAAESSVGTWTDIQTMKEDSFRNLAARIIKVDDESKTVQIAYPIELFEGGNAPQLLSDVAGNVFGLKEIKNLRVKDIDFPEEYVRSFLGPAFGIEGIRSVMQIEGQPLLGTIIKPKVGLDADEHAQVAYDAWVGGVDVVKDDENLTDQDFNPFEERVVKTIAARMKAEEVTGKRKMYVPNITASAGEMEKRAVFVKSQGGRTVMVDILTVGFSGVDHIRRQNYGLILHGHRAMHGAFTHGTRHGVAMLPIAKIARLCGIDQLHTGTIIGKMEGGKEEVSEINDAMRKPWYGCKPTLPIASGGVHPGLLPEMVKLLGNDVIINMGGGIHGHPGGTTDGAKAARQSLESVIAKVPIEEYAKDHPELAKAVEKWGSYNERRQDKTLITYTYGLMADDTV